MRWLLSLLLIRVHATYIFTQPLFNKQCVQLIKYTLGYFSQHALTTLIDTVQTVLPLFKELHLQAK